MGQVRHGSATTTRQSCNTAIASFALAAEPGAWYQPQDRRKVAQARDGRGPQDRADGTSLDGPVRGRGGNGRGVPPPYAAAAGRLPLCPAVIYPASDTVSASSLPSATRHLAPAGCRRRQAQASEVQALPYRLLPH